MSQMHWIIFCVFVATIQCVYSANVTSVSPDSTRSNGTVNDMASSASGDSVTKRRGFVSYIFPEPNNFLNGFRPLNPISRASINGHWVFPQGPSPFHSFLPHHMDLSESVSRFSYSPFMKDSGLQPAIPAGLGFNGNETRDSHNSSVYSEYGRRNAINPNNQKVNLPVSGGSSPGQSRSDGDGNDDLEAELKQVQKDIDAATGVGTTESPSQSGRPSGPMMRPGPNSMMPMRPFRPRPPRPLRPYGRWANVYGAPTMGMKRYEVPGYRMRPLSAPGFGPFDAGDFRPYRQHMMSPPFPRPRFAMKSVPPMSDYPNLEPVGPSPNQMMPLTWDDLPPLEQMSEGSAASPSAPIGSTSFDSQPMPMAMGAGLSDNYPLIGGPNPIMPFHLSGFPSGLYPSGSTPQHHIHPTSGTEKVQSSAQYPTGQSNAVGGDASLAELQKAHPGLHPEQYQYLQQWYAYLNQPMIKSYVDSFREPESSASDGSDDKGDSNKQSTANNNNRAQWFRNLKLFPQVDMTRLQLPKVREIFKNIRTGLVPGTSTTSTTTTESTNNDPYSF